MSSRTVRWSVRLDLGATQARFRFHKGATVAGAALGTVRLSGRPATSDVWARESTISPYGFCLHLPIETYSQPVSMHDRELGPWLVGRAASIPFESDKQCVDESR
jgi:hypothetical protein